MAAWAKIPIISRDLFERVQALRPVRQAQSRRHNTRYEYLLRARVSCTACGLAASGRPEGRHTYYGCHGHQSRGYTGRLRSCTVCSRRTDRLDALVWEDVCQVLSSPQIITAALRKAHTGDRGQEDGHERRRHLQRARQKVERQIERLGDAVTAEGLTLEALKVRRAGLQERRGLLTPQERELRLPQQQQGRLAEWSANGEELCQSVGVGLQTLAFAGRRKLIELLVDRVILSQDDVESRYALPLDGLHPTGKKETLRLPYRAHACLA